jgi:hypothetical protein
MSVKNPIHENIEITLQEDSEDRLLRLAYIVNGVSLDNYAAYLHVNYPGSPEVADFYEKYETASTQELKALLAAVSNQVQLTALDGLRMVVKQVKWQQFFGGQPEKQ